MHVLLVDDSRVIHSIIKDICKDKSYELSEAWDGSEGLDILKGSHPPFDIILLDWEMPNVSGLDFLKEYKRMKKGIPVILCTTKTDMSEISQALSLGASEYVAKPFAKEVLLQKISEVTGKD